MDAEYLMRKLDTTLVQMDYLLCSALICPVSNWVDEKSYYFIDSVYLDIFLRERTAN